MMDATALQLGPKVFAFFLVVKYDCDGDRYLYHNHMFLSIARIFLILHKILIYKYSFIYFQKFDKCSFVYVKTNSMNFF